MADLERKRSISTAQFGLVIVATSFGAQVILSSQKFIKDNGNAAFLVILLSGATFFVAAYLQVKLGQQFPKETFVEYMPRLWGKTMGGIVIFWFIVMFFLVLAEILNGTSLAITMFMFDRTPPEVVAISLLMLTLYCAVQDFGTIVRVLQIMVFVPAVIVFITLASSMLNFDFENLQPLWPVDISKLPSGIVDGWDMFSGYEFILLLLPLVSYEPKRQVRSIMWAFIALTCAFLFVFIAIIGVMTVKAAANTPYPTIITMRALELPGIFLERLENYLLLAWIPTVFDTLALILYGMAQILSRWLGYSDHRPWALILTPLIFCGSIILQHSKQVSSATSDVVHYLGLGFSFLIVPISLILLWRRKQGANKNVH